MVYYFPGYVFGRNAAFVDEGNVACCLAMHCLPVHCLIARAYVRGRIREKQGIRVSHFKLILSSFAGSFFFFSSTLLFLFL